MQANITVTEKKNGDKVYTVTVDGQVVGTRTSKRVYTHALVQKVIRSKVLENVKANYARAYEQGSQCRKNYAYSISEKAVHQLAAQFPSLYDDARIAAELQEKRDYLAKYPTFDALHNENLERTIAGVMAHPEERYVLGNFCGRPDLAAKELAKSCTAAGPVFLASV